MCRDNISEPDLNAEAEYNDCRWISIMNDRLFLSFSVIIDLPVFFWSAVISFITQCVYRVEVGRLLGGIPAEEYPGDRADGE